MLNDCAQHTGQAVSAGGQMVRVRNHIEGICIDPCEQDRLHKIGGRELSGTTVTAKWSLSSNGQQQSRCTHEQ